MPGCKYLEKYLLVPSSQIVRLTDAGRNSILIALYDLRDNRNVKSGDHILVFYSGHGTSYSFGSTSINAICLIDRISLLADITIRELHSIFLEFSAKSANVTTLLDCCHSGDLIHPGDTTAVRRTQPIPNYNVQQMLRIGMRHSHRHSKFDFSSPDWTADMTSFVQLAACGRGEEAAEMEMKMKMAGG